MNWTPEQLLAISHPGGPLLVSASAGSGKTAVLVARVMRLVLEERVDIDRLLVVTFTRAAAEEMKARIRRALQERLQEHAGANTREAQRLRRQIFLLGRAPIQTLHAYLADLLRRHGQKIGLSPRFTLLDDAEAQLLQEEVLRSYLREAVDRFFREDAAAARAFLARYGHPVHQLGKLEEVVLSLVRFARVTPDPEKWFEEVLLPYRAARSPEALSPEAEEALRRWQEGALLETRAKIANAVRLLEEAIALAREPGGPQVYLERLLEERDAIATLAEKTQWDPFAQELKELSFERLPPIRKGKGDEIDPGLKEAVTNRRDKVKKAVKKLQTSYFARPLEEVREAVARITPDVERFVEWSRGFLEAYERRKRALGVLDFEDLEQLSLKLLRQDDGLLAKELRATFEGVLVDEAQDLNPVQMALLREIAPPEKLFFVGDVKQSIYGFRLAEPRLFLELYERYTPLSLPGEKSPYSAHPQGPEGRATLEGERTSAGSETPPEGFRVDLPHNFRSIPELLDGVNRLIGALMEREIGGIDYHEGHRLLPAPHATPQNRPGIAVYFADLRDLAADASTAERESPARDPVLREFYALLERHGKRPSDAPTPGSKGTGGAVSDEEGDAPEADDAENDAGAAALVEFLRAEGEARVIARALAEDGVAPEDTAILLRSRTWLPVYVRELERLGVPVRAVTRGSLFDDPDVQTFLNVLRVVDNPARSVPLVGVLSSPVVGLTAEELAAVRIAHPEIPYWEAVFRTAEGDPGIAKDHPEVHEVLAQAYPRLRDFVRALAHWRDLARDLSTAELAERLLRELGFDLWGAALPTGRTLEARLRRLVDWFRRSERRGKRPLGELLEELDTLAERDLFEDGEAAAEDEGQAVRILTIHQSKGLEFPVVVLAGLAQPFYVRDAEEDVILHRDIGVALREIDAERHMSYPTLPWLFASARQKRDRLAEELRLLYVALTRAREKVVLPFVENDLGKRLDRVRKSFPPSSSVRNFVRNAADAGTDSAEERVVLPVTQKLDAHSFAELLFPVLYLEAHTRGLAEEFERLLSGESPTRELFVPPFLLRAVASPRKEERGPLPEAVPGGPDGADETAAHALLARVLPLEASALDVYPWVPHTALPAKLTVTEIRKRLEAFALADDVASIDALWAMAAFEVQNGAETRDAVGGRRAPSPWGKGASSGEIRRADAEAAEEGLRRGTAVHTFLRFVDVTRAADEEALARELDRLVEEGRLTPEDRPLIPLKRIWEFFLHPLGQRLRKAESVHRERPFLWNLPAEVAAALLEVDLPSKTPTPAPSGTSSSAANAEIDRERPAFPTQDLQAFCAWVDAVRGKSQTPDNGGRTAGLDAVVVQGIFDVLFREDGGYVLLDYKTDRILDPRIYKAQLYVYACAVRDLLGELPREGWLYAFGEELAGKGRFGSLTGDGGVDRAVRIF
ncbi:UvrD-helicase domain-containing protein [Brockia lithotrophica]|uniref:DNA 3'-5' helicase n=1 Tax=Brockia lithotrophica TaxID=933949 RepID=A0A660L008_9BACL|nr:UvrD-helicase domain-containing protein [Brockia lithotrophica]RKQ84272.1 ATP-dependent helicase/nuclease subunit A [Brockia lithotrophica]